MAINFKSIEVSQVSASLLAAYTAPAGAEGTYSQIRAFTVAAEDRDTLEVYIVESGGTATTNNRFYNKTIAAGESKQLTALINHILKPGDFISVRAVTGARLNLKITVKEVS